MLYWRSTPIRMGRTGINTGDCILEGQVNALDAATTRRMTHGVGINARSSALFRFAAPFFAMGVLCLLHDSPVPLRQEQRIRIAHLRPDNAEIARRVEQAGVPLFPVRQKLFDFFA